MGKRGKEGQPSVFFLLLPKDIFHLEKARLVGSNSTDIILKPPPTVGAIICVVVSPVRVSEILATNLAGHRQRDKNNLHSPHQQQSGVITIAGREMKIIFKNLSCNSIYIYFLCSISCISISFYFSMKSNVNGQA